MAEVRPRRQRRAAAERRVEVLEAARRTFVESGFDGATMRVIAARSDVNEAMLYRYFSSKEELFEEAVVGPLEEMVNGLLEVSLAPTYTSDEDVREQSIVFLHDLLTVMEEIAPLLGVMLTIDAERAQRFYQERFEPVLVAVEQVTRANLPLWAHGDFDPQTVVRVVFGICWFVAIDKSFGSRPVPPAERLAPELLTLLWDGLRSRETD